MRQRDIGKGCGGIGESGGGIGKSAAASASARVVAAKRIRRCHAGGESIAATAGREDLLPATAERADASPAIAGMTEAGLKQGGNDSGGPRAMR